MKHLFEPAEHISAKASINDILAEVKNSITAKNILIITTLLCLVGLATACENKITDVNDYQKNGGDEQSDLSLVGTKWKFVGFFDVEKNTLKELEPKKCEECYTLEFYYDSLQTQKYYFQGKIATNLIDGEYSANESATSFEVVKLGRTQMITPYSQEEDEYFDTFWEVRAFELTESKLKLFFNEKKNYYLFAEVEK